MSATENGADCKPREIMKAFKVSIAMATYNGERFLKAQLDSFARQTLLPFELVACDDGSTDNTMDILRQFAAEAAFPVRIYRNPERLGIRDNFLRALEICEGDLVAFSDQDDVWLPEKLAACAAGFEPNDVTAVTHGVSFADAGLKPVGGGWPRALRFEAAWLAPRNILDVCFAGSSMVLRRQVAAPLLANSELRQAFIAYDMAMGFLALACGRVISKKEILSLHRCHDENTSGSHDMAATPAVAYLRSVGKDSSRLLAAKQWLKAHTRIASAVGEETYAKQAQEVSRRAQLFLAAAKQTEEPLRKALGQSSDLLRKRAAALLDRSLLYRDTPGRARVRFCGMVARGRYMPRDFGGLGLWSLAKDSRLLFQTSKTARSAITCHSDSELP